MQLISDCLFDVWDIFLEADFFFLLYELKDQPFYFLFSEAEESSKIRAPTTMKKFEDSEKAKKPVRSMIETRGEKTKEKAKNNKKKGAKKEGVFDLPEHARPSKVLR